MSNKCSGKCSTKAYIVIQNVQNARNKLQVLIFEKKKLKKIPIFLKFVLSSKLLHNQFSLPNVDFTFKLSKPSEIVRI